MFQADCSICDKFSLIHETITDIINYINMFNPSSKRDFGLYQSAVQNLLAEARRLQQYHEDYHARGDKEKSDTELSQPLPDPNQPIKSVFKPRRWKSRFKNG